MVQLANEDIEYESLKWNKALILYIVGNTPSIGSIERFIANQWNFITEPKVLYHSEGYFVIRMSNTKERDEAWAADFNFNEEVLKTIPLWAKLPNLALNCWSKEALSKIGSGLGRPLYADNCTTTTERISYARILVEIDVTRPIPYSIKICDPKGKVIDLPVMYDWEPVYYQEYCQIGHSCKEKRVQLAEAKNENAQEARPKKE
ncbi:hypothetical protein FXO38_33716 [Capsicum annuum]|nr:hypothetical protein FXO38_33716 [Capsicum annuum]